MDRQAAVAGQFYPGGRKELQAAVVAYLRQMPASEPAIGLMVPHAGYVYSGAIAGVTFGQVNIPDRVVLLGPNHTGYGVPRAVYPSGVWHTPLGAAQVDGELACRIVEDCPGALADELAHRFEHSLEVQVPFIQVAAPKARLVPVCLAQAPLRELMEFGICLGRLLATDATPALLVASSDMTHFESAEAARSKDEKALERILALDPEGLYRRVAADRISMCGVVPTVVMLAAARELGAQRARLVRYGHSGERSGDYGEVVGYAGVIID